MDSKYIYCTKCGHKNLREQKFCTHCGASLVHVQSEHSNKNFQHQSISKSASLKRFGPLGVILAVIAIIALSTFGYRQYQKHQRSEIRSYVYTEFKRSDYRVKINQKQKSVKVIPDSTSEVYNIMEIALSDADGEEADNYETSVKYISRKIEENIGNDWTVSYLNPTNSKRSFWIYKDGKCKYRLQDHVIPYYSNEDYGDDDFDY